MKKFLIVIFLIIAGFALLSYQTPQGTYLLSYSSCDNPVTYRLGEVDPRFKLSKETVLENLSQAASIWNATSERTLFAYDPEGKVTINFVYDKRQELSTEVNSLEQQLDSNKNNLDPQVEAYKARSAAFESKLRELNAKIEYWNNRGGAPQPEYDQLEKERVELNKEADELNSLAASLNQSTSAYNLQVRELNQTVNLLNRTLEVRPEEGIYNPNDQTISIYFNNTKAELIHTLAHELGHARGLDHTIDPQAIMYASSTEVITPSVSDKEMLKEICREKSYPQVIFERYSMLLQGFQSGKIGQEN